jgi:hypothetical protein
MKALWIAASNGPRRRLGGEEVQLLFILDPDTRCGEWSASGPGSALNPGKEPPWCSMDRGLGGPQSWSGHKLEEKSALPSPGIEPRWHEYGDTRWNDTDREKQITGRKTYPSATVNPAWTDPGANPCLRGKRPVTNRLNQRTAKLT